MKQKRIQFLIADSIGLQVVANIIIEQSSYTRVFQYLKNVRSTLLSPYSFSNQAGIKWEIYGHTFSCFLDYHFVCIPGTFLRAQVGIMQYNVCSIMHAV